MLRGDVCDPRLVRRALLGAEGCFHLAAVASVARANEDWLGTHRINLGGSVTVLEAARALDGIPVVYASSAAVYGYTDGVADERSRTAPLTAYGADKLGSELHAAVGTLVHGLPTLGLRFFNVYGPRQDPRSPYSGVISIFADAIARGQPVTIHGDGQQSRDLIFVSDIVAFLAAGMRALAAGRPGVSGSVLNACTGRETSVLEMAGLIGEVLGQPVQLRYGLARPGDIRRSLGCPARAASMLQVEASVALRDGLLATVEALNGTTSLVPV